MRTLSAASSWQVKLNATPSAAPLRIGSTLLVPTFDGKLLALDESSTAPRTLFAADFPLRTSPVALSSGVVVTSEDGTVSLIDPNNGKVLWKWQSLATISTRPIALRVLDALKIASMKLIIVGDDDGNVTALDASDGKLLWARSVGATVGNGLAASVDGAFVYVPLLGNAQSRGGIVCLDAKSGAVLWKVDAGASCVAIPMAGATASQGKEARLFACADNGSVLCFDATGKRLWKTFVRPLATARTNEAVVLRAEPLLKVYEWGARLFVGGNDGVLRCLDARQGRELWSFPTGAPVLQRPFAVQIAQNGVMQDAVIVGAKSQLCALDVRSGALLWHAQTHGEVKGWSARDKTAWSVAHDGVAERFAIN